MEPSISTRSNCAALRVDGCMRMVWCRNRAPFGLTWLPRKFAYLLCFVHCSVTRLQTALSAHFCVLRAHALIRQSLVTQRCATQTTRALALATLKIGRASCRE